MPNLVQVIVQSAKDILKDLLFSPIKDTIKGFLNFAFRYLSSTPYPSNVSEFKPPTNGVWPVFYHELYNSYILFLIPTLFGLALGLAMFFNILGPLNKKRSIRRAVFAYPLAFGWWWYGGWFLKLTDALGRSILGNSAEVFTNALTAQASAVMALGIFGGVIYAIGGGAVIAVGVFFLIRRIAIYVYMLAMPILLMFWLVPIKPVQNWAKSMMSKFVPLVLMPLPAAFLIRVGSTIIGNADKYGTGVSGIGKELTLVLMGFTCFIGVAYVPKYMMSMSSQISSAIRTGGRIGRAAAAGAKAGGGGGTAVGSSTGGTQTTLPDTTDPISERSREDFMHEPKTDFTNPARQHSRRRRQRRRAAKVGAGARKVGQKSVDGLARTSRSYLRNRRAEGSTAKGMADDAKTSAKRGLSDREERIRKRMQQRGREIRDKFTPDTDPGTTTTTAGTSRTSSGSGGSTDRTETTGSQTAAETDTTTDSGDTATKSGRQTYDRNQSERETGNFGSRDDDSRSTLERNRSDRRVGTLGSSDGGRADAPDYDQEGQQREHGPVGSEIDPEDLDGQQEQPDDSGGPWDEPPEDVDREQHDGFVGENNEYWLGDDEVFDAYTESTAHTDPGELPDDFEPDDSNGGDSE